MTIERELSQRIGREYVLEASAGSPYNSDSSHRRGLQGHADAVALPGNAQEVAAVVSWCYDHDVPVVPRGGGTGLTGGAVPTEGGVVLSLERLRAVRELEPGLWRMFPEAGVSTRDVRRLARENGLFFGPDPGAAEQSQIGGNVATNAGGPHALRHGVTGAWVTGLEVVLAPGELVQVGGWARKDVAGYDLKDLLIGSEGTLGVITAVRLRLLPAPEMTVAFAAFARAREEGCQMMLDVLAAGIQPAALEFLDATTLELVSSGYPGALNAPSSAGFAVLIELDGSEADVAAQREMLLDTLAGRTIELHEFSEPGEQAALWHWRDGFNGVVTGARGAKVSEDVSFPLERLQQGLERFDAIALARGLRPCGWGHGGDGNVHATVLVNPASDQELDASEAVGRELFELVHELDGSIAAEHGVGSLKSGLLAAQWDARAVELHEAIKRAFDPKGLLNPGKKLARAPGEAARAPGEVGSSDGPPRAREGV